MSDTPPEFSPPDYTEIDDTKRRILGREFDPLHRQVNKLAASALTRNGQLSVLTWLVGVLIAFVVPLMTWIVVTIMSVQSNIQALTVELHTRVSDQQHQLDRLEH